MLELGRSGCKFDLNGGVLTKISPSIHYNDRLFNQYIKQQSFRCTEKFDTPETLQYNKEGDLNSFSMKYIKGMDFNNFCINSDIGRILDFINSIISFIDNNLSNSFCTKIDSNVFSKKIHTLQDSIKDKDLDKYFDFLSSNKINTLPIGYSHGDLTMANIIFSDKFYLIDFLDNLFETPLNDIIKIMQDAEHHWYLNITSVYSNKVVIFLNKLKDKMYDAFKSIIDSAEYVYLAILNLLRIIPYVNSKQEQNCIMNGLKKYEHFIADCR